MELFEDLLINYHVRLDHAIGYIYIGEYTDGPTGHVFGKYYKRSRCRLRKWVVYDGRVYID